MMTIVPSALTVLRRKSLTTQTVPGSGPSTRRADASRPSGRRRGCPRRTPAALGGGTGHLQDVGRILALGGEHGDPCAGLRRGRLQPHGGQCVDGGEVVHVRFLLVGAHRWSPAGDAVGAVVRGSAPVTHPMEVGSKARKDHRQVTTNDAGPGRPVGPRSTPGEGTRGAGIRHAPGEGKGSGRRVPVLAADQRTIATVTSERRRHRRRGRGSRRCPADAGRLVDATTADDAVDRDTPAVVVGRDADRTGVGDRRGVPRST